MNNSAGDEVKTIKLLLVSIASPPKGSTESLQVSKYLKYLINHQLRIYLVTSKLPRSRYGWTTIENKYKDILNQIAQNIQVPVFHHRFIEAILRRVSFRLFLRPDNEFLFTFARKRVLKQLEQAPDVIYSRSTPFSSAILALKLKKHYRVPWIMHMSDPWSLSPLSGFKGAVLRYHQNLEQKCFKSADKITFTSKEQVAMYEDRYPEFRSKFMWFPNVFDDEEVVLNSTPTSTMSFLHSGNFYGPGRSPAPMLDAIKEIEQERADILEKVAFLFTGHQEPSIKQLLDEYQSVGVKHLGALPLEEVYELQRKSNVLVIFDWQLPKDQAVFFLSKTLDYIAAGKPIIAITTPGSSIYKIIQGTYGHCFAHDDIAGIKQHILNLVERYKNGDKVLIEPYKPDKTFSASYQANKLFELIANQKKSGNNQFR